MSFPDFFDEVPRITLRDPLAELLGSVTGGLLSYGYADVVRLAGHSCPTVASAVQETHSSSVRHGSAVSPSFVGGCCS
jgi:hypothetical protein